MKASHAIFSLTLSALLGWCVTLQLQLHTLHAKQDRIANMLQDDEALYLQFEKAVGQCLSALNQGDSDEAQN